MEEGHIAGEETCLSWGHEMVAAAVGAAEAPIPTTLVQLK